VEHDVDHALVPLGVRIDRKRLGGRRREVRRDTGGVTTTLLGWRGSVEANGFLARRLGAGLPLWGSGLLRRSLRCSRHVAWGLVLVVFFVVGNVDVVVVVPFDVGFGGVGLFVTAFGGR
jgi:hypothetical protein